MAPPNHGTAQLRAHRLTLSGRVDQEADTLGVLFGRNLIDKPGYRAGSRYAALTAVARRGWGMQEGSVSDLWRRLVAGSSGDVGPPHHFGEDAAPASADRARTALARQRRALEEAGLNVPSLSTRW